MPKSEEPQWPFRQVLVHKINGNSYQIVLVGLTLKDKAAIVNQFAEICQLSQSKAEQHFYFPAEAAV